MKVIELSYDHLSDHVKPCLLYLASYQKDERIRVDDLKALWCAEGLVQQTEMKSVEEVMEVYLDNLISSSLVIGFTNEIGCSSIFQIHDLVHDFCLIKAREEKLFDLINSSSDPLSPPDFMPRQMTIEYNKHLHLHNGFFMFNSEDKRHFWKHLYSLEITGDMLDDRLCEICHLRHLRLLRVLNLNRSFIKVNDSLLNEICMFVHLRFLSIRTEVKSLPLCFSNLWNLETLLLDNGGSSVVLVPVIWNLVNLQLLSIQTCVFFDLDADESVRIEADSKLKYLRVLDRLVLSYSKKSEDILKRFPNLQELFFDLVESWDCSMERYWFPKLDFLNELESLTIFFESSSSNGSVPSVATNWWDFHFPLSLKVLFLYEFPLTSDSLSTIARLPNLEELFLESTIIQGEEWNMGEEDTFKNLKFLRLRGETLAKWKVGEESFPVLEELILDNSHKIEEILPTFGDIDSLKSIKLISCSHHLEESARKIKEYVEDMTGNDKLHVSVLE